MEKVVWTEEARRWLEEIYDYIAEDNEEAAYRTVRAIHERAEILLSFPELGYRGCYAPPRRLEPAGRVINQQERARLGLCE
ncbi:MAG: type II toxin-antitoxin system RelE/ParE family toxin [Vicinamibacterales bacterium]|nr:type II toxin-antitoxin system RelE/ParE family toxin [Vicinamibacterales bacterium]